MLKLMWDWVMIDFIMRFIPAWLLLALAALAMLHRWYVTWRWEFTIVSRWENAIWAIALTNIAMFYAGRWLDWWELSVAVAISRLVWAWLLIATMYISYNMARRHNEDGLG